MGRADTVAAELGRERYTTGWAGLIQCCCSYSNSSTAVPVQPNKSSWDIVTEGIKIELLRIVQLMPNINRYVIQCETDKRSIRTITYRLRVFLPCRVKEDCGVFMQLQQEARVSSVSSEVNEVVNLNIRKWASRIPQFHEIHNPTKNIISRQATVIHVQASAFMERVQATV